MLKKRRYSREQGLMGLLKVCKIHLLLPPTLDGCNAGKSGRKEKKRVISSKVNGLITVMVNAQLEDLKYLVSNR